tara:strand:- start:107 stop:472 length:366 start_codon:yes stop_codon:yes gene_type:complete
MVNTEGCLATIEELRKIRKPIKKRSGVYFLFDGDELIYIGQTINEYQRVAGHFNDKIFDSYTFMPCLKEELNTIESVYIDHFKPKLNGRPLTNIVSNYWDMVFIRKRAMMSDITGQYMLDI